MLSNTSSILLYCFVGLIVIAISVRGDKKPKLAFWSIVIILTVFAGIRAETVGIDTYAYTRLLQELRNGFRSYLSNINELGFLWLSYAIVNLFDGYTMLLIVFAFMTNFFVVKRLFESRQLISLPIAIYVYYFQYYFMTFNTIRQWIAIAIVFFFSKFIKNGKKGLIIFLLSVVVASLFHNTAIVALAYLPIYYFSSKKRGLKYQLSRIAFFVASPFLIVWIYTYFMGMYGQVYGLDRGGAGFSLVTVVRLLFVLFLILIEYSQNKKTINDDLNDAKAGIGAFENVLYVAGLVFYMLTAVYYYADRVGQYFILFELLALGRYTKYRPTRQVVILFSILFVAFLRFASFQSNGFGELPYITFWRK